MKIKRAKKVSKILSYFKQNFGFHSPYLILIDGTFCAGCLTAKVNIKDQLPKWVAETFLKFIHEVTWLHTISFDLLMCKKFF